MRNPTRIGALLLVISLVTARFVGVWPGAALALLGAAVLATGLVAGRRARRSAAGAPPVNWAEDFTARVRRERAQRVAEQSRVEQPVEPVG